MSAAINTQNFPGTVILKDWMRDLEDRQVLRVTGLCTLVRDEDYAGFKTRGTESNWAVRVTGRGQAWTILGCQIRAVVSHELTTATAADGALLLAPKRLKPTRVQSREAK